MVLAADSYPPISFARDRTILSHSALSAGFGPSPRQELLPPASIAAAYRHELCPVVLPTRTMLPPIDFTTSLAPEMCDSHHGGRGSRHSFIDGDEHIHGRPDPEEEDHVTWIGEVRGEIGGRQLWWRCRSVEMELLMRRSHMTETAGRETGAKHRGWHRGPDRQ
jgi:hypothetical protein